MGSVSAPERFYWNWSSATPRSPADLPGPKAGIIGGRQSGEPKTGCPRRRLRAASSTAHGSGLLLVSFYADGRRWFWQPPLHTDGEKLEGTSEEKDHKRDHKSRREMRQLATST